MINKKHIHLYMKIADDVAEMSHATRLKVGSVVVKNDNIISFGWNGTPAGWDNNCENRVYNTRFNEQSNGQWIDPNTYQVIDIDEIYPLIDEDGKRFYLKTKPEVLHSEMNSLMKLAKSSNSGDGASMILTHSPCLECAKGIYQAGIKEVFYKESYRSRDGIEFLEKCGIAIQQYNE